MEILLAEGRPDVRSALRLFLEQDFRNTNISEATKASDLLVKISALCPDMLILDWELPELKIVKILGQLRGLCPEMHIVATSGRSEVRQQALEAGADAFISKSDTPQQMTDTIKSVIN